MKTTEDVIVLRTQDKASKERERCLREVVGRAVLRPPEQLGERLLVGPAEECARKLAAYEAAELQMAFVWPVADELK